MRIEEVLGPRGELKDLASPPGAILAYVYYLPMLSGRYLNLRISSLFPAFRPFSVFPSNEDSAPVLVYSALLSSSVL